MDEDNRRNKIEAGKKKLKRFMKKRNKKTIEEEKNSIATSPDTISIDSENVDLELEEHHESDGLEDGVNDLLLLSKQQNENHQNEIKKRDMIILRLTSQLDVAIEAQQLALSQRTAHADVLAEEVNVLRLQLKEATEVLERYKVIGQATQEQELLDAQNKAVLAENKNAENEILVNMLSEELASYKSKIENAKNVKDFKQNDCQEKVQELELINAELIEKLRYSSMDVEKSMEEIISLRAYIDELMKKNSTIEKELAMYKLRTHSVKENSLKVMDCVPSVGALQAHATSSARGHLASEQLSSTDMCSWQVQAAQTNSRLLNVLSDLVTINLDIERDINTRLIEFGLTSQSSEIMLNDDERDDAGQSAGSREDCTGLSVGESPNLELTEDGPDLTPRAWDLFTSVASAYDTEVEGEDVVIGSSRRLRCAVSHVLNLLSLTLDKTNQAEYRVLRKRNEDLANDLRTEYEGKDYLQISLVMAETESRKLRSEKQVLEDENHSLMEDKEILSQEITTLKSKLLLLEDQKDLAYESKKFLEDQCYILSTRLGEPERTTVRKTSSCSESNLHESSELLQENAKLSSEKQKIQMQSNKERHSLSARVQHLEITLEEMQMEKEELTDKYQNEIKDLKAQIEAMEKQLQSSKKFQEEQDIDREQEREEYLKEIKRYKEALREKDKSHNFDDHLTTQAEALEQQLKDKIVENMVMVRKKEDLERELRHSLDKINDLKDIISEYEKQLEMKSKSEDDFKQKLLKASQSVSELEKYNTQLKDQLDKYESSQISQVPIKLLHDLQEQLTSKSQDLTLLSQSHSVLQELRGQIHFLEAKVHRKIRRLEAMHLVSHCASPGSSDTSQAESHDSDAHNISCSDGWEMSPRSVNWLELHRLEEKINRLIHLQEELMKENENLNTKLKGLNKEDKCKQDLMYADIQTLHSEKKELAENFHKAKADLEKWKMSALNTRDEIETIKKEVKKREHNEVKMSAEIQTLLVDKKCLVEKLQKAADELERLQIEAMKTKDEMEANKIQIEKNFQMVHLIMEEKEKELLNLSAEYENQKEDKCKQDLMYADIQTLHSEKKELAENFHKAKADLEKWKMSALNTRDEIETIKKEAKHSEDKMSVEIQALHVDKKYLIEKLQKATGELERIEIEAMKTKDEMETYKIQFEKDFQMVQDMMEEKEKELSNLNAEFENQLRLGAVITTNTEAFIALEYELEEIKLSYENDTENWAKQKEELIKNTESLKHQIHILESHFKSSDDENIDVNDAQHKIIIIAEEALKVNGEDSRKLFKKLVFDVLKQFADSKLYQLKNMQKMEIDTLNLTWQKKLEIEKLKVRNQDEAAFNEKKRVIELTEQYKGVENSEGAKKSELESYVQVLEKEKGNLCVCMREQQEEFAKQLDEIREVNNVEVKILNEKINQRTNEKGAALRKLRDSEALTEANQQLYEKELVILKNEFENKLLSLRTQMNIELEKQKIALKISYEEQKKAHEEFEKQKEELKCSYENEITEHKRAYEFDCANKIKIGRTKSEAYFLKELKTLQIKFNSERETALTVKEKELRAEFNDKLLKKLKAKTDDHHLNLENIDREWQEKIACNESNLKQTHQIKINEITKNYLTQLKAKENEISALERYYQHLLKDAGLQDSLKRKKTDNKHSPNFYEISQVSDVNLSSDDTCSSCHEDLFQSNHKELLCKIEKEGQQLLMLTKPRVDSADDFINQLIQGKHRIISQLRMILSEIKEISDVTPVVNHVTPEVENVLDQLCAVAVAFKRQFLDLQLKLAVNVCDETRSGEHVDILEAAAEHEQLTYRAESSVNAPGCAENIDFDNEDRGNPDQSFFSPPSSIEQKRAMMPPRSSVNELYTLPELELSSTSLQHNGSHFKVKSSKNESLMHHESSEEFSWLREAGNMDSSFSQPNFSELLERYPSIAKQLHHLYWKYKRTSSYLKAVIYQKRYLMGLLTGYQATEEVILVTLALLHDMNINISFPKYSPLRHVKPSGCALFRSVVFVVIAVIRMKFMHSRWHQSAVVPAASVIKKEVDVVIGFMQFQNSGSTIESKRSSSSSHTLSTPTSSLSIDDIGRKETERTRIEDDAEPGHLMQYVFRLEQLHRQLGLSDFKKN